MRETFYKQKLKVEKFANTAWIRIRKPQGFCNAEAIDNIAK